MKRFLSWICLLALVGCGKSSFQENRHLIGRDPTWFPLQLGEKANSLTAFTTTLVQEIDQLDHLSLEVLNIDWSQLFRSLDQGKVEGIFASLSPNVMSEEKYTFSDPIVLLGPVLVVPSTSLATSLTDFEGKIVAAYQFDGSVLIAQEYPCVIIQLYQNMPTILEELAKGNVDAVLMPVLDACPLVSHLHPQQLKVISAPLNAKGIRLITLKDKNSALIRAFNKGLQQAGQKGIYQKLRAYYQVNPPPSSE